MDYSATPDADLGFPGGAWAPSVQLSDAKRCARSPADDAELRLLTFQRQVEAYRKHEQFLVVSAAPSTHDADPARLVNAEQPEQTARGAAGNVEGARCRCLWLSQPPLRA
jgi:hypothetical protein